MKTMLRILILAGICTATLATTLPTTPSDGPFPPDCLPPAHCPATAR